MDESQQQSRTIDCGNGASALKGMLLGARSLPGQPDQALAARAFVDTAAGVYLDREDDLLLLTSELVTNSIRHSRSSEGGQITIFAWRRGHAVRIEVIDDGADTVPEIKLDPQNKADPMTPNGHGLYLVEKLADCWGTYADEAGRVTWFELADEDHQAHEVETSSGPAPSTARRGFGSHVGLVPP